MNRRTLGWLGFFGICGLIAWVPEQFFADAPQEAIGLAEPAGRPQRQARSPAERESPKVLEEGKTSVPQADLFAAHSWFVAPVVDATQAVPVSAPIAPAAPTAPPLPFQFIGKLADSQQLQVFLQNGERLYVVRAGDVIDELYRIEHISPTEMSLVYLPLSLAQTLPVGSAP